MQKVVSLLGAALLLAGCTTNQAPLDENFAEKDTLTLCRMVFQATDPARREKIAALIIRRGGTAERCQKLIANDQAVWTGIAVAGVAAAAGAAASNGGYYAPVSYGGVAWDQFYNQYYQLIWRCRDRSTGRFVEDYYCAGKPMVDSTWPGWRAY